MRTVYNEDGNIYSDTIAIYVEGDVPMTVYVSPDLVYTITKEVFDSLINKPKADSELERKRVNLSKLVKVGLKGILLMYGSDILDQLFGSKDHPKPGKKDDLLDWYQEMFIRVGISYLLKNDTFLTGTWEGDTDESGHLEVTRLLTRPIRTAEESNEQTSQTIGESTQ